MSMYVGTLVLVCQLWCKNGWEIFYRMFQIYRLGPWALLCNWLQVGCRPANHITSVFIREKIANRGNKQSTQYSHGKLCEALELGKIAWCIFWMLPHDGQSVVKLWSNKSIGLLLLIVMFFFFFEILSDLNQPIERKKEKSEKLPNGKSDQETCRDSNWGPFAYWANALPTEPQVTVRGEWSSNPT